MTSGWKMRMVRTTSASTASWFQRRSDFCRLGIAEIQAEVKNFSASMRRAASSSWVRMAASPSPSSGPMVSARRLPA